LIKDIFHVCFFMFPTPSPLLYLMRKNYLKEPEQVETLKLMVFIVFKDYQDLGIF
jgi:hypothetical protein